MDERPDADGAHRCAAFRIIHATTGRRGETDHDRFVDVCFVNIYDLQECGLCITCLAGLIEGIIGSQRRDMDAELDVIAMLFLKTAQKGDQIGIRIERSTTLLEGIDGNQIGIFRARKG